MLISDCCGAPFNGGVDYEICSSCLEHCGYVKEDEEEIPQYDFSVWNEF